MYKILHFKELHDVSFSDFFHRDQNVLLITTILILMFFNWSVETIKWKILIQKITRFKFFVALKIIFSGIAIGIFTPNRIGEIGGRILFLDKGKRTYGFLATSLGSFAQLITTVLNGLAALILLLLLFPDKTDINPLFDKISVIVVLIILAALVGIYFNAQIIKPILLRFSFFQSREKQIDYFSETDSLLLLKVLLLSLLRYGIFIVQFFLLLNYFNVKLDFSQAYVSIGLIYLFTTLIPTTTLVELGIRGSFAIFFFGLFSSNVLGIVLATFILWIVNLALPSVLGSFFVIRKNLS